MAVIHHLPLGAALRFGSRSLDHGCGWMEVWVNTSVNGTRRCGFRCVLFRHALHSSAAGSELRPHINLSWVGKEESPLSGSEVSLVFEDKPPVFEDTDPGSPAVARLASNKEHHWKRIASCLSLKVFSLPSPLAPALTPLLFPRTSCPFSTLGLLSVLLPVSLLHVESQESPAQPWKLSCSTV